ncbi:hypothetical protein J2X45_002896 [Caulobacter sp. BE264]|uniref:hypothetical protein n=1 Tax=Caulobacter sp. BE264 TaxID=2817724 RepID=UPI0028602B91|nr:hypothetical protein [Caulobacter sp. BE264]MDR7231793.1 hypothetical protein [Caulobacter sp. BE264]
MIAVLKLGFLVLLLSAGLTSVEVAPTFSDSAAKGSLMVLAGRSIPVAFHGVWAEPSDLCARPGDRKARLVIGPRAINALRVVGVEAYSDHPAIVARLRDKSGGKRRLFLDISTNHRYIRVSTGSGDHGQIWRRCARPSPRSR